jgi:hypothetical protein
MIASLLQTMFRRDLVVFAYNLTTQQNMILPSGIYIYTSYRQVTT